MRSKGYSAYLKGFNVFIWIFLGIINAIVIPDAIVTKNYQNIIICLCITVAIIAVSLFLDKILLWSADEFVISEDTIAFVYKKRTTVVVASKIQKILVTPSRYIFVSENEKNSVNRIHGIFKGEKQIDPRISDFAAQHGIRITSALKL